MFKKILGLNIFLMAFAINCYSESFSFSNSNSGYLNPGGYYYYYVYQYVYYYNGSVMSESHTFSFYGALSEDSNPKFLGLEGNWMIYEGKKHFIAIPCVSGECIYIKNKTVNSIPSPSSTSSSSWQKISSPIK